MTPHKGSPGSGNISRRPSGAWMIRVSAGVDPVTGRRRQVTKTIRGTRRDAQAMLAKLLAETASVGAASQVTVADLIVEYLRGADLSPTTRDDYQRVLAMHLEPKLSAMAAWKVRTPDINAAYRRLTEAGVSPWRVRRLHEILRHAFTLGVRWEWLVRNPVVHATPPRVERKEMTPPSADELARILGAVDEDFAVWLRLAAVTGARRGEVCALRWSDVELDHGRITFRRAVVWTPSSGLVVKETKTGRVKRLALDATTITALRAHRRVCVERALALGRPGEDTVRPRAHVTSSRAAQWDGPRDASPIQLRLAGEHPAGSAPQHSMDDAYLFADLEGRPWRPDRVTQRFVRLRDRLELPHVKLHGLRHALATQLLADGMDVRVVAGRLGHARTSTTTDVYAAWLPERDREAADRMGRLVGP